MAKNKLVILLIIVIVVLAAGLIYVLAGKNLMSTTGTGSQNKLSPLGPPEAQVGSEANNAGRTVSKNRVVLKSNFQPETMTIKAGETVTWTNDSGFTASINSDPHPIHTDYGPMNNVGQLMNGEFKSFTFNTPGTYKYHNNNKPEQKGTIVVQ